MNIHKLKESIRKYNLGEASPEEIARVEEWYDSIKGDNPAFNSEKHRAHLEKQIGTTLKRHISPKKEPGKIMPLYRLGRVAAAVLIVFSLGLYFYIKPDDKQVTSRKDKQDKQLTPDIEPGGNKAVLTLADGSTIILDNAKNGELVTEGSTAVNKTKNGQLVYDASAPQPTPNNAPKEPFRTQLSYNTITTPPGGQYQVILPDGTKVWLNAASSLRFPTALTGKERNVELTGEAYFEVAKVSSPHGGSRKGAMPFIVASNNMGVEVLGTHFNIMAYADESSTNTTLLEGSVRIIKDNKSKIIVPGQQARVKGGNIGVADVDTKEATAWKNGYFIFRGEDIQSIMRQISRWYNVKVEYQGDISGKVFGGKIARSRNVSEVLEMLELTGSIHFKIVPEDSPGERRIIVMP